MIRLAKVLSKGLGLAVIGTVLSLSLAGLYGCKVANWKAKREPDAARSSPAVPQRTASADAAVTTAGIAVDVDERTGRLKSDLVLRLDYFPDPQPGVTNLPVCYAAFPSDFELGLLVCEGQPDLKVSVLAKNVEQDCYTDPREGRAHADVQLALPGCRRAQLLTHVFAPPLRIDIEVRDVN